MEEAIKEFGLALGHRALRRNWKGVHALLAPWLQRQLAVEDVRTFFERQYRLGLQLSPEQPLTEYPEFPDPQLGGNTHTNATDLRQPISWRPGRVRPVAPEVTDENMCYWMHLELLCSTEQLARLDMDTFASVWIAVVRTPEGLRVGYWNTDPY